MYMFYSFYQSSIGLFIDGKLSLIFISYDQLFNKQLYSLEQVQLDDMMNVACY